MEREGCSDNQKPINRHDKGTLYQIIPEMSHYFSVVDSTNMVSATKKIKALRLQKLRNMLLNNAAYKQAAIDVFMSTKIYYEKLIKRIWDELKK